MRTYLFILLWLFVSTTNAQLLTEDFSSGSLPTNWGQEDNHSYNWMVAWYWEFSNGEMQHIFVQGSEYQAADAWAFTSDIAMISGNTYRIEFNINTNNDGMGLLGPASAKVTVGQGQSSGAQSTILWSDANITNSSYVTKSFDYTCTTAGNYNFAFHCFTPQGGALGVGANTYIDDVVITEVGATLNDETDFLSFTLTNQTGTAIINTTNHTIDIEVSNGTGLTSLTPNFTLSTGATADISGTNQTSGTSTNDYGSDVIYTVTAENTTFTQNWTISVEEQVYQGCADTQNIYGFTYNGNNYEVIKEERNWNDAAACAVERGGYLAQINTLEEQNAIYDAIINGAGVSPTYTVINNGGSIAYVWIGATDNTTEGTWLWNGDNNSTGTAFWSGQGANGSGGGAAISGLYNNWGGTSAGTTQEPDNYGNDQDNAAIALAGWPSGSTMLGVAGEWNDIIGTSALYYVVEYTITNNPEIKDKQEINMFPNPTKGIINITGDKIISIDVYNIMGKKVYSELVNSTNRNININLSNKSKGTYIINVITEEKSYNNKIILN